MDDIHKRFAEYDRLMDLVRDIIKSDTKWKVSDVARMLAMDETALGRMIGKVSQFRGHMSLLLFIRIIDVLGYEIELMKKEEKDD
jgi:hypothetical protein